LTPDRTLLLVDLAEVAAEEEFLLLMAATLETTATSRSLRMI
jgi:hypothetical protein